MTEKKTSEPLWWALFSAGGVVAAFLVPIHLFLHSLAAPLGWAPAKAISYERMVALVGHPLVKIYLLLVIALPLYHWAHRFRFILLDLGIKGLRKPIAVLCYGGALLGTAGSLWVLWRV